MQEQHASAIAIFADVYDVPKILIAQRSSGPNAGHYTCPGGKNEGTTQVQTMRDELHQETGYWLPEDMKVRRIRNPIRFVSANIPVALSLFYSEIGKSIPQEFAAEWIERNKLLDWQWKSLSWLRQTTNEGLFPKPVFEKVVYASRRLGVPWVGDMTAAAFDFPHWGLHSVQKLRSKIRRNAR
jgi:8-oxo-dGTP pyrophosphatase MutT (NUDIX family)